MQHPLITPMSPAAQLAALAAGAKDAAYSQQTRTAGSATYHNPDGTKTLMGADAAGQGIAPWVGDTTPPGVPTGVSAGSGSGLILVSWDGGLEGGVPPDFDHVQILVDGADAGRLTAAGTLACGPYGLGTEHAVTAVAWDDAHGEDGGPAPNASPACSPLRVTVTGADVEPGRLGITVTKSDKEPQGSGVHTGDLWLRYTAGSGSTPALAGEWWWDGTKWVSIPVAIYLDQLAARGVQVDSAVIGLLSAGIIKSGTFVTPDGLVGFDASGFWVKDTSGGYALLANKDGIMVTGRLRTSSNGSRIEISQSDSQNFHNGYIAGVDQDDNLRWAIDSNTYDDGTMDMYIGSTLAQDAAGKSPEITISSNRSADTTHDAIEISSAHVGLTATSQTGNKGPIAMRGDVQVNGRSLTAESRRIVEWISDWSGSVGWPEGDTKWEYETTVTLRDSPTGGQWLQAELGVRLSAREGEYVMTISITGVNGTEYFRHHLFTPKVPGVDSFSTSKAFMLPNGTYHVRLGFTRWGAISVPNEPRFAFTDWTPGRGVRSGYRYFTLTELN